MWDAGEMDRAQSHTHHHHHHHHHYRDSNKLRKLEKIDKLEKLEMMDDFDRVKHLEAQMLRKISALDLEPKEIELMEEQVWDQVMQFVILIARTVQLTF